MAAKVGDFSLILKLLGGIIIGAPAWSVHRRERRRFPEARHGCGGLPAPHLRPDHLLPGAPGHRGLHHARHRAPGAERQQRSCWWPWAWPTSPRWARPCSP